ncbi:response regulator transcription factor [Pseudohongiella nitratireducens]|uniref:response regulator transcription factor n=1 Tax=Pseudohongiella nitratireducens TaxID=1768907 RepID=UPI0030EDCAEB|tara:strand:+ start:6307 stop:7065 length:759 start_codon:yes stop_codon:yes gene_type:complete
MNTKDQYKLNHGQQHQSTRTRLLIVEDQRELARNISEYLQDNHYELDFAVDGLTAMHLIATQQYDVIVIDLMIPGVDGFSLCDRLRQDLKSTTPVLIMTALGSLDDKARGFRTGADDYLVKPFDLLEFKLRVDALARRGMNYSDTLNAGPLSFYPGTLEARFGEHAVTLTGIPARLFEQLMRAHPRFLSHEELISSAWRDVADTEDYTSLRTHIYALRSVLQTAFGHGMVKTVYGRGYCLSLPTILDSASDV